MSNNAEQVIRKILSYADIKINGPRAWDIQVKNDRVYGRILSQGSLGLGESYLDGDWSCKSLDQFFYKLTKAQLQNYIGTHPKLILQAIATRIINPQSLKRSKKVAEIHYDLGNDLYQLILDRDMQYTCAYWKNAKNLDQAQLNKLDLIAKKLKLKPGMRVLELGSGFGGLARHLAKYYGVKIESYNISKEQIKFGKEICKGLSVIFHQKDYRTAQGQFDRVVSIGMMEHVGPKNYKELMQVINRCLKKPGIALVHTIGRNTSSLSRGDPWMGKYIFPGGHLPSLTQIAQAAEGLFVMEDVHNFGPDYDKTLMAWHQNTNNHWDKLKDKYGPTHNGKFKKIWDYYLLSCAGSFRSRNIQLWQTVLSKGIEQKYEAVR